MTQNKKHQQTLESAQYGLEISFKQLQNFVLIVSYTATLSSSLLNTTEALLAVLGIRDNSLKNYQDKG